MINNWKLIGRLQGVNENPIKQPDNFIKLLSRILRLPTFKEKGLVYISPQ